MDVLVIIYITVAVLLAVLLEESARYMKGEFSWGELVLAVIFGALWIVSLVMFLVSRIYSLGYWIYRRIHGTPEISGEREWIDDDEGVVPEGEDA